MCILDITIKSYWSLIAFGDCTCSLSITALDAYVLLELYDFLLKLSRQQNSQIDMEPMISMKWLKPSKNEKRRAKQRGDHKQKAPKKLVCMTQFNTNTVPRTPKIVKGFLNFKIRSSVGTPEF